MQEPDSILITQCLQNDFVQLINKYEPMPNLLHVGYDEARRLLGERVEDGPVNTVMEWAYAQPEERLAIIHIRDWHDETDPEQKDHLKQFGPHCLEDSRGAEFVFRDLMQENRREYMVNASGLNDFHNTNLEEILEGFRGRHVRVGLMGVWTDAKISFLAYELKTRYPEMDLGICNALTASSSRSSHFIAMDRLENILGLRIFSSIGAFTTFLNGDMPDFKHRLHPRLSDEHFEFNKKFDIAPTDKSLLLYLFRECKAVDFDQLDGGFSGNVVLKALGTDHLGHKQAPTVVKIGPRDEIAQERTSFERIQEVLGNNAPAVVDFAERDERGAIKYRYAAMTHGKVQTFQDFYNITDDVEAIKSVLNVVFDKQLGKLYEAAEAEQLNLLEYYEFSAKYGPSVAAKVADLVHIKQENGQVFFPGGRSLPDVSDFYNTDLKTLKEYNSASRYHSYIHGDLNGKNIIIDAQQNVWLIDFFHTHRGHILKDLIKLENDILYIFTKIRKIDELEEAFQLSDLLVNVSDLGRGLNIPANLKFNNPSLAKAAKVIQHLRSFYPDLIVLDRDPYQLHVALLRYAMHTLSFDESNELQKVWALYTGTLCSEKIKAAIAKSRQLRIDFIDSQDSEVNLPSGMMGLTILPGRRDWGRVLEDDLRDIHEQNINHVLCLLAEGELTEYGVPELKKFYRDNGLEALYTPILDQGVPTAIQVKETVAWMHELLSAGKNILIHCVGGLGRSGTIAAAYLVLKCGMHAPDAIQLIRDCRSPRAVENHVQEDFLFNL